MSFLLKIRVSLRDRWFRYFVVRRYLAKISRGDVVIDCGANVGVFTEMFAKRGATVYAFEPHPVAFELLKSRTSYLPGVTCINKAVSRHHGRMKLYLPPDDHSIAATQSASLMSEKDNVSIKNFVEVDVIRLVDFIERVKPVRFLKLDVEGAEYDILSDMFESDAHRSVNFIVVETHERNLGLLRRHHILLEQLKKVGADNVDLNWH